MVVRGGGLFDAFDGAGLAVAFDAEAVAAEGFEDGDFRVFGRGVFLDFFDALHPDLAVFEFEGGAAVPAVEGALEAGFYFFGGFACVDGDLFLAVEVFAGGRGEAWRVGGGRRERGCCGAGLALGGGCC